jgi:hypothetical protein
LADAYLKEASLIGVDVNGNLEKAWEYFKYAT